IDQLAARHADVDFVLCGRFEGLQLRDNLIHLGHAARGDIARALRSCDAFLNLSENDPAPNVVIEALASGLPVLYRDSGGVPELVGDCGLPVTIGKFRESLDLVLERRELLAKSARERAVRMFSPEVVFPQYLAAMASATRRPPPSTWTFVQLAARGFPVVAFSRPARSSAPTSATERRTRAVVNGPSRIGWVTYDTFQKSKKDLWEL